MNSLKLRYLVSVVVLILFAIGCGKQPDRFKNTELEGAPSWVLTPKKDGMIVEVGSAPPNKMNNFGFQRELAMANARTNLAKRLNVKVKAMFKTFSSQTSANGGTFDLTAESVSKQITKQTISGSVQLDSWISRSGTLYVLVGIDANKVADMIANNAKSAYGNDIAAYQKLQAAKAQGELAKELSK